ncbi:unnamed protein product, partial [Rotaria magnacalcarata]
LVFTLTIVQYHSNINKVSILLYICPTSYRGEGLPYIGVKLAKATLVPIARTGRYIDLPVVCSIHARSMSVREEVRLSMAPSSSSRFLQQQIPLNNSIQSKWTQM